MNVEAGVCVVPMRIYGTKPCVEEVEDAEPQEFATFSGLGTGDLFEILSKNSKKISNGTTFASSSSSRQKSGANFVRFRLQHTARVLSLCERMCQEGQKAKLDQGGGDTAKRRGDIIYYMRQAKSIDAKEARDGERRARAVGTAYAFGSSTPRSLSHMSKVPREQRVYDAKLAKDQRTSATAFDGVRASATNPHLANKRWVGGGRSISTESRNEEDEAASEPDIVQDRMIDFMRHKKDSTTTLLKQNIRLAPLLVVVDHQCRRQTIGRKRQINNNSKKETVKWEEEEEKMGRKESKREEKKESKWKKRKRKL